ncbi:MAG: polymerase sigma-70 factor [Myxococcaceae bacterium]|nr:polymerase sigma-70 factor [Myxococcaceae bacterium]
MNRPALEVIEGGKSAGRVWLKELYLKFGGSVHGRCQYLLKDAAKAEDAMQDVFARALLHEREFRGESSPLTWLLKITTHHCLNLLRGDGAKWRGQYARDEQHRGEGHGGPQLLEKRDLVRRALESFDLETQSAVVHYWVDEMTLEEIAVLLGRSVPTIRKRLREFTAATQAEFNEP